MEKKKSTAIEFTILSCKGLQLDSNPKSSSSPSIHHFSDLLLRRNKPRSLVSLCLGVLGQFFEDIVADLSDVASEFPPDAKLAMVAIARRRQLLNDHVLLSLAESSWALLDISGSDVSDSGLSKVAEMCINLQAVDISRCDKITVHGVSALINNCRSLEILRLGGSPRSEFTARGSLNILKPELNDVEGDSWEDLDSVDIGKGALSLRWLVWPKIDENSSSTLATECPRIIVNPKASPIGFRGLQVPTEALASIPLDHSIVEDIDPKTWAVSGAARRATVSSVFASTVAAPEISMAEKFRLAFLERDARLAPKRAKNARQHRRRAEKEWLLSSSDAKAVLLASQASKYLRNK
ncbi:uncharacterized protein LOC109822444 [Asparagus officinalis]|uniref:uncharacterized protein LOC109822444 n=1 Tax=Asparagus officinalis TaxID=4686 RepID=UPI00098E1F1B|nr:uncharacterized protein LOC109822444 [Asparagus officinalis]